MSHEVNLPSWSTSNDFTSCCTDFYNDDLVKFFLGDSYHPGGLDLTRELAQLIGIETTSHVLDVACGIGSSAIMLATEFGCRVTALDLNPANIAIAQKRATELGLDGQLEFVVGRADHLTMPYQFDQILCECSFCIFESKPLIAESFYRLLKPGGMLGVSDVAVEQPMPIEMERMVYRIACVSGALSMGGYRDIFAGAGFVDSTVVDRGDTIMELYRSLRKKLVGLKLVKSVKSEIKGIDLRQVDADQITSVINQIKSFVTDGFGTYCVYTGKKPR